MVTDISPQQLSQLGHTSAPSWLFCKLQISASSDSLVISKLCTVSLRSVNCHKYEILLRQRLQACIIANKGFFLLPICFNLKIQYSIYQKIYMDYILRIE